MVTQFTASEHLNDPGHLSEVCLMLHCVERLSGPLLEENQRVSGWSLCESNHWIQSVDVLVEAQSPTQLLRSCSTCAHLFVSFCFSQFLLALVTCTDDPHRLKRAIQVSNQVTAPLIVHPCNRIVEQIVDVPMPQNSGTLIGSHRKQIAHSLQPNSEFWA